MPEPLREKLGPEGAQALADLLNETVGEMTGSTITVAEERFERRLTAEVARLESRLVERLHALDRGLREDMRRLEVRLLRWTFVFWIGQFAALVAILFGFFRA
jgi:hypothetical protein